MTSFLDLIRNIEKEAKTRASNAVKEETIKCINCSFSPKDGEPTEKCTMCGMSTRHKFTRTFVS